MGIVKSIARATPGVGQVVAAAELASAGAENGANFINKVRKHPGVSLGMVAMLGLGGTFGYGYVKEKMDMSLSIEDETSAVSDGHGTITKIDVTFPDITLAAATVETEGTTTKIGKEVNASILGHDLNASLMATWVDVSETVQSDIDHDSTMLTVEHDSGPENGIEDDRFIVSAPVEAFSVTNYIEPAEEKFEFHGDLLTMPENLAAAWAGSVDVLKSVPGVGDLDQAKNAKQQLLLGSSRLSILDNVAQKCMPIVVETPKVYQAIHDNIANVAPLAIRDSEDPKIEELKQTVTAAELEDIEVVVYIGAESDAQPFLPNQMIRFENQYTEQLNKLKEENSDLTFPAAGDFECEMSDDLKALVGEETATANPTEASTASSSEEEKDA